MNPFRASHKILLVDDDKDMCESLADVLTLDADYGISFTTDPFKALELVKAEDFSLIVLDYKMPEMTGLELLKRIKEIRPDVKVFLLTAFISNELIEHAKKEGAARVLSKFIWPDEIIKHIKEALS
ncbi:MAG: response regulator [Candidatus Omnitrophica bacterium]|jgi:CheY-like chemotaxis protein|nr:response regulator [Candidatus Omnitrophota bacterium]MDD4013354.1 response regulator [Candidatus Omnitrophota bacterium]